jgi:hypothetical protein
VQPSGRKRAGTTPFDHYEQIDTFNAAIIQRRDSLLCRGDYWGGNRE